MRLSITPFQFLLAALAALTAAPAPAQTVYTVPGPTVYQGSGNSRQNRGRRTRQRTNSTGQNNAQTNPQYNQQNNQRSNQRNTQNQTGRNTRQPLPPLGAVDIEDSLNTAPAVSANGLLYFGSWNHQVTARDQNTGAVRWKFVTGDVINASPTVGPDGTVYVTSRDKNVYALDSQTGAKKWHFATGSKLSTRPAVSEAGLVYVGTSDKKVIALEAKTGAKKWEQATLTAASSPALGLNNVVYVSAGKLYALDGAAGTIKWSQDLNVLPSQAPTVGPTGTIYVGTANAQILALDKATGQTLWQFATGHSVDYPIVLGADDTLYVSARKLFALRTSTGQERWERTSDGNAWSAPAVAANGILYVGDNTSKLFALNPANGRALWQFNTNDGLLSFPSLGTDGAVYVQCEGDSKVYSLNRQTGQPLWTSAQDSLPSSVQPAVADVPTRTGRKAGG